MFLFQAWIAKHKNNFSTSTTTTETIDLFSSFCAAGKFNVEVNKANVENIQQLLKECKTGLDEWGKINSLEKAKSLNKYAFILLTC